MIKGYTDINQSKTLAEILPLESADMYYDRGGLPSLIDKYVTHESIKNDKYHHLIPCWSFSALLNVLPDEITDNGDVYRNMFFHLKGKYIIQYPRLTTLWPALLSVEADNPIDACVGMIAKLKENNLI